ncbi:MAG: hypothetical protein DLM62_06360 [Pseudonocardiales bacterium]|nr:MAG: hypothetical protein DLM62_06360 [Pseudonocardiales bacterium]
MTALVMAANLLAGRLTNRYGPVRPMVIGELIRAAGLLALITVRTSSPTALILALLIPLGVGGGLAVPPMTTALLEAVDADRSGLAGGIPNSARQLGGAVGVAVFGALIATATDFDTGMRTCLELGGAVLILTAAVGLALHRKGTPAKEVKTPRQQHPAEGRSTSPTRQAHPRRAVQAHHAAETPAYSRRPKQSLYRSAIRKGAALWDL